MSVNALSLIIGLCLSQACFAETAEEEVQLVEGATCTREKDERRLEAQTKDAGCVLIYTKHGKAAQIGQARKGVELCREKLRGVRATLEKSGYNCK